VIEVSNDTFGHTFYVCEACGALIWANLRADLPARTWWLLDVEEGGREGVWSSLPLLLVPAGDPDPTGLSSFWRLFSL